MEITVIIPSYLAFDAEDGPQNKLQKHRREAIDVFENQGFPTRKLEDWKYTSLRGLTKESFRSDYFIQNASFLKIDNITLGYTFEDFMDDKPLRLYFSADNVLVETKYDGIDPEITGGIDDNFYPRSKVFAIGLNFNF